MKVKLQNSRQVYRRSGYVLLMLALCLSACMAPSEEDAEPQPEHEMFLSGKIAIWPDFYTESNSCDLKSDAHISPEGYERASYLRRAVDGRFQSAMNIDCIISLYSEAELQEWRATGDPVAAIALLIKTDREEGLDCAKEAEIELSIIDIARINYLHPAFKRPVSRIPEAYAVANAYRINCHYPFRQEYVRYMEDSGMYYDDLMATQLK